MVKKRKYGIRYGWEMTNVQVAFQGGGAKLVNLLAAAEVLEEAHNSGKITITRIAGTSAGSIAACVLASGLGVARARDSLLSSEMQGVAAGLSNFPSLFASLWSACRGKPLKSIGDLSAWLASYLNGRKNHLTDKTISDVCAMRVERPMKLLVVTSDLRSRGSHVHPESDPILAAIEASCGIPIVFRTWKNQGYERVDGGLCSNLPVDFLLDKVQEFGEVLAISFEGNS